MANVIRIKRRVSGTSGAPAALKSAELGHNEVDDTRYVGKGDDGGGNATSVIALAGKGAFVDRSSAQTVGGKKTFSAVRKSQFDAGLAVKAAASHGHAIAEITSLQTTLDAKAPLASPALTGVPTAPTAAGGTSSTQIATWVPATIWDGWVSHVVEDHSQMGHTLGGLQHRIELSAVYRDRLEHELGRGEQSQRFQDRRLQ